MVELILASKSKVREEILRKRQAMGGALGLSDAFVKDLLEIIHNESIRKQNEIMNESESAVKQ